MRKKVTKRMIIVLAAFVLVMIVGSLAISHFSNNNAARLAGNAPLTLGDASTSASGDANASNSGDSEKNGSQSKDKDKSSQDNSKGKSSTGIFFDLGIKKSDLSPIIMDKKATNMSSKSNYLALVNCTTHKVGIYQGSKGNWKRIQYFDMANGKPETPTIHGTYETGPGGIYSVYKIKYFDSEGARCWWATRIDGPYLFHSVLYVKDSEPKEIKDGRLNEAVSHGCIRMNLNDAKWIYDNIPADTKVEIYD